MNDYIPTEFRSIFGHLADQFEPWANNEYHGPCPFCGGDDRFSIWTDKPYPHWNGMCRKCLWRGWIDQISPNLELTPPAESRKIVHSEEEELRRKKLEKFTTEELWMELHRRQNDKSRAFWRSRGIPDEWQDKLKLGYTPKRNYKSYYDKQFKCTSAHTIPFFSPGGSFKTLQYRLENTDGPKDRYRFEKHLGAALYPVEPNEPIKDVAIICEAAIKGIVTRIKLAEKATVLAVPNNLAWFGVEKLVRDCGLVIVILDPDSEKQSRELAKRVGKNSVPVQLPGKIDDLILAGFGRKDLWGYVKRFGRV